jgi:23S rRNA pseudouridine1911/1915/1917 synthase
MKSQPEILYEDNHLLVVVKPENLPVQGDRSGDPDLMTLLKADLKRRYQKPGNVFVGMVHRLDRPAGGIMVFAKTSKAAARLSEAIRERQFKKIYFAVTRGNPEPESATLTHYLRKDSLLNKVRIVSETDPEAKKAVLDYRVIATVRELSLVEIALHTGRPHQIRVQMSAIGCPLFGDQKYGSNRSRPGEQMALWALQIEFKHPTRPEVMRFKINPPQQRFPWNLFQWNEE